ncbi:Ubiquitin-conjugating enzyme subunit [Komagataella phaffii CBS 7435]|uniref:E2 ubiquitin-conjugating enzyme PEX4 n=3 Tax=Komagataella TaxID=460517 RepID=PEX4_KOMPG|nr:Peroxisomal ubiquitin conjugating enzyme [Komagataella phaffii GS115]P49428.1 RecName: Full=Ubiquitin-conjugating enzyme E2-24 kDa; AltName: Full=E2 ubiquitin-conjugating enzyme PEX4; AltName: Full=Peroxin-4; AltName: Full=Ubiquitin carrier protein; AltName: Full=Ubiquitin-protein ligase [Komagataella pastoris]AOA64470.1 GQ67_04862T0 [Komagataella phaffii]CAH2450858.1 Ubiquitin-conjugating enzyme subunit [Komagataella phaffii CBS 7435]AAA53634.1 Pas4 [Komagataella pastoris]AOA69962.1 GQ68_0
MSAEKRLLQEYRSILKEQRQKGSASTLSSNGILDLKPVSEDNFYKWTAKLKGPTDTGYQDAFWELQIDIPSNYPTQPPKFTFIVSDDIPRNRRQRQTNQIQDDDEFEGAEKEVLRHCYRMPHPNIAFNTGEICLDILQAKWTPAWTLSSALTAIVLLLNDPEPLSPLDIDMANLMKINDLKAYNSLIEYYVGRYSIEEEVYILN